MFGLNVCSGEPARFVSTKRGEIAAQRLRFIATSGTCVSVERRHHRGQLLGYAVVMRGKGQSHEITENDVDRFGL